MLNAVTMPLSVWKWKSSLFESRVSHCQCDPNPLVRVSTDCATVYLWSLVACCAILPHGDYLLSGIW